MFPERIAVLSRLATSQICRQPSLCLIRQKTANGGDQRWELNALAWIGKDLDAVKQINQSRCPQCLPRPLSSFAMPSLNAWSLAES